MASVGGASGAGAGRGDDGDASAAPGAAGKAWRRANFHLLEPLVDGVEHDVIGAGVEEVRLLHDPRSESDSMAVVAEHAERLARDVTAHAHAEFGRAHPSAQTPRRAPLFDSGGGEGLLLTWVDHSEFEDGDSQSEVEVYVDDSLTLEFRCKGPAFGEGEDDAKFHGHRDFPRGEWAEAEDSDAMRLIVSHVARLLESAFKAGQTVLDVMYGKAVGASRARASAGGGADEAMPDSVADGVARLSISDGGSKEGEETDEAEEVVALITSAVASMDAGDDKPSAATLDACCRFVRGCAAAELPMPVADVGGAHSISLSLPKEAIARLAGQPDPMWGRAVDEIDVVGGVVVFGDGSSFDVRRTADLAVAALQTCLSGGSPVALPAGLLVQHHVDCVWESHKEFGHVAQYADLARGPGAEATGHLDLLRHWLTLAPTYRRDLSDRVQALVESEASKDKFLALGRETMEFSSAGDSMAPRLARHDGALPAAAASLYVRLDGLTASEAKAMEAELANPDVAGVLRDFATVVMGMDNKFVHARNLMVCARTRAQRSFEQRDPKAFHDAAALHSESRPVYVTVFRVGPATHVTEGVDLASDLRHVLTLLNNFSWNRCEQFRVWFAGRVQGSGDNGEHEASFSLESRGLVEHLDSGTSGVGDYDKSRKLALLLQAQLPRSYGVVVGEATSTPHPKWGRMYMRAPAAHNALVLVTVSREMRAVAEDACFDALVREGCEPVVHARAHV